MSEIRVNNIIDEAGTGAPTFPNGATGNLTGNVTGTASLASGLTGTPNITVGTVGCSTVTSSGDVNGVNATFSGNLTVQGTTTTIDTAVTSVDSLAVDGQITGLGVVGVGTASPTNAYGIDKSLHVHSSLSSGTRGSGVHLTTNASGNTANDGVSMRLVDTDLSIDNRETGLINFLTAGTERLRITSGGTAIFKAGLAEKSNRVSGTLGANPNNSITDGNIIFFAGGNESGNLTINFTDIHANLAEHECCSFTVVISPNGSGVITAVTIDGQTPADGLKWSGGSAPSAGASGVDIYTFTIRKYGTANTNYGVYGAATNYA